VSCGTLETQLERAVVSFDDLAARILLEANRLFQSILAATQFVSPLSRLESTQKSGNDQLKSEI
jgi:hypothetical protein